MADDEMKVPLQYPSGGTDSKYTPGDPAGVAAIVSPPQLMTLPAAPVSYIKQDDLAPHSFLTLAIIVAFCCGFFHILILLCSIPAIVLSCIVREFTKQQISYISDLKIWNSIIVG